MAAREAIEGDGVFDVIEQHGERAAGQQVERDRAHEQQLGLRRGGLAEHLVIVDHPD